MTHTDTADPDATPTTDIDAILAAHAPLPSLAPATGAPDELECGALVVGTADDDGTLALAPHSLGREAADAILAALTALGLTGRPDEVAHIPAPAGVAATTVVATGTGPLHPEPTGDEPVDGPDCLETLRRAAAAALGHVRDVETVGLALPARDGEEAGAVAVGAVLGTYTFTAYSAPKRGLPSTLLVCTAIESGEADEALERAAVLADAVVGARDLVNTTSRQLTPDAFARVAERLGEGAGVEVEILDEHRLAREGHGALLGVGQGSVHPPRLVRVTWDGTDSTDGASGVAAREIALVGKGITFDSGGLSLKPPASMETMKTDMAGAAAVLHAVLAAASLRLPVRVSGWLALAENMPGGAAQRPGDVVTALDGTTIEVLNTDAEGRLVMADALTAARRHAGDGLDLLVDVATLTGAQIIALGARISGVMGTPAARERVLSAASRAGEPMWPAPLPGYVRGELDSPIADIKNKGERSAGMLTAGVFLRHFAGDAPWAHIDIAGPSFNEKGPRGHTPRGATGAAVPTLLALLEDAAAPRG